jgi:hypothetical protein
MPASLRRLPGAAVVHDDVVRPLDRDGQARGASDAVATATPPPA